MYTHISPTELAASIPASSRALGDSVVVPAASGQERGSGVDFLSWRRERFGARVAGEQVTLPLPAPVSPVFLLQTRRQMVYFHFNNFIGNEEIGRDCQSETSSSCVWKTDILFLNSGKALGWGFQIELNWEAF